MGMLKSFCTAKERVTRLKRQPMVEERKKIFANDTSNKELITRNYREVKKQ
jgi:hypothetical protein